MASPRPWEHPSFYPVEAVVGAVSAQGGRRVRVGGMYGRGVTRLGLSPSVSRSRQILVPLMGPRRHQIADAAIRGRPVVLAWDVWQDSVAEWIDLLRDFRVQVVFCTSTAAQELLRERGFEGDLLYLPEATSVASYRPGTRLTERAIQVLELGRRWDAWHDPVQRSGLLGNVKSRYELERGQVIFDTRDDLIDGFASSAVSVCFPRSVTHPAAGEVETFTHRYLESMASGCLVLGHAPADLIELFGYNPVIEADIHDAPGQLRAILNNLGSYQDFVDRNLERVKQVGDWRQRAEYIADVLLTPQQDGSSPGGSH
ncbi:glycosyltransferase [Mycetocola zhadangensis]|uniref:glycosyltransferase family protein n=1 Tax=Mycetocola zhadangensis TaxID=1164595 RepID=UPI003A4D98C4